MDAREYEALKQRAEEEHRQNLAAIERVWIISQANGTPVDTAAPSALCVKQNRAERKTGGKQTRIIQDVRAAIKNLSDTFIFSDVLERLAVEKPNLEVKRGTLKAVLKKLSETGELELVTQGIGRRPTKFRRK